MDDIIRFGKGRQIRIRPGINMVWEITVDYGDIWATEVVESLEYGEVLDYAIRKAEKLGWREGNSGE